MFKNAVMMAAVAAAAVTSGAAALDPSVAGCADGSREGFLDLVLYPDIASCAGAWSVPGLQLYNTAPACPGLAVFDTVTPQCGRQAGNDGANSAGTGCNAADVCAPGWNVCRSARDVEQLAGTCTDSVKAGYTGFFATRQSSNGCNACALGENTDASTCNAARCTAGCAESEWITNDVYGCGNLGGGVACGTLNRASGNLGSSLPSSWHLNAASSADNNGLCELATVYHSSTTSGGVLCCREEPLVVSPFNCVEGQGSCHDMARVYSEGSHASLHFGSVESCE